jgi:hypothetical protein
MLSVCVNHGTDIYEILYEHCAVEGHPNHIIFDFQQSVTTWQMHELVTEIMYGNRASKNMQLLLR